MAYLRRWRMTLARQDLDRGHRVQAVARRYGYGSSEALARAFQRQFGLNPVAARQAAHEASLRTAPPPAHANAPGPPGENSSTLPLP
jgi:AraC-like DNA-binding protein